MMSTCKKGRPSKGNSEKAEIQKFIIDELKTSKKPLSTNELVSRFINFKYPEQDFFEIFKTCRQLIYHCLAACNEVKKVLPPNNVKVTYPQIRFWRIQTKEEKRWQEYRAAREQLVEWMKKPIADCIAEHDKTDLLGFITVLYDIKNRKN